MSRHYGTMAMCSIVLFTSGCASPGVTASPSVESPVLFWDSPAYRERVTQFTVRHEEAAQRAAEAMKRDAALPGDQEIPLVHFVVVDDDYLFSSPSKSSSISLWGYRVNGRTGAVTHTQGRLIHDTEQRGQWGEVIGNRPYPMRRFF